MMNLIYGVVKAGSSTVRQGVDMLDSMIAAIQRRRTLKVWYDPGPRVIEPHAIGRSREGHILVRAYQTGGASAHGEPVNWKLFRLDRFSGGVESLNMFATPRPGYRAGDPAMKGGIIAEV